MDYEVTKAEIDAGFKLVEVETRFGKREVVKLVPVPWRRAQTMLADVMESKNQLLPLEESLTLNAPDAPDALLTRLTPFAVSELNNWAWALCFGNSLQKKMMAIAKTMQQATAAMASAPNSPSSAPGSVPVACAPGASPS